MKWFFRTAAILIVGFFAYTTFDFFRAGYHTLPELPDNAYPISFKNGLRAIVYDVDVPDSVHKNAPRLIRRLASARPDRRYLGVPMDVAPWFEDTWSECHAPPPDAIKSFEDTMPEELKAKLFGARFDAFCGIRVDDGKGVIRGAIYSVPRN